MAPNTDRQIVKRMRERECALLAHLISLSQAHRSLVALGLGKHFWSNQPHSGRRILFNFFFFLVFIFERERGEKERELMSRKGAERKRGRHRI